MTSHSSPSRPTDSLRAKKVLASIRQHPKKAMGAGAIALLLLIGIPVVRMQFVSPEAIEVNESTVLTVETLTVEAVDGYETTRTYTGEVAALRASDLGFERSGELETVLVQEGDLVTAGTPLAQLDTRNLQTQRQQLEADQAQALAVLAELEAGPRVEAIAAAEASVRQLEQDLALQRTQRERREFLYEQGAISKETLDEFTYGQGALQAQLEEARSRLEELRNGTRPEQIRAQQAVVQQLDAAIAGVDVNIQKSTLRSPFAGIVSSRKVDEGTVVGAGQSVVRLVEDAALEARIGMPTTTVSRLQPGDTQTVTLNGDRYEATVTAVLPEVDPETRTQVVVLQLDRAAVPHINPGQTVRAEIAETVPTEGIWIPTSALTQDIRGLWSAYLIVPTEDREDRFEIQPQSVEILHQESNRALVRGTLQTGDRVVANGVHRLVPGQQVRLNQVSEFGMGSGGEVLSF
ncbi:MAG: efflux RND transporter periplasmic adaptor subunit [Leptolyngbya sp. SIO4C1]|nr:efflux RND transporter periplasmic adaptor subunit [Leptolyngbya sp. SIO4C1]